MAHKHQDLSYRTRNGVRYDCDGDIYNAAYGDLREQAKARVKALKAEGRHAFYEQQDDGAYYRVFATKVGAQTQDQHGSELVAAEFQALPTA